MNRSTTNVTITGNTFPIRAGLKAAGFQFDGEEKSWSWAGKATMNARASVGGMMHAASRNGCTVTESAS